MKWNEKLETSFLLDTEMSLHIYHFLFSNLPVTLSSSAVLTQSPCSVDDTELKDSFLCDLLRPAAAYWLLAAELCCGCWMFCDKVSQHAVPCNLPGIRRGNRNTRPQYPTELTASRHYNVEVVMTLPRIGYCITYRQLKSRVWRMFLGITHTQRFKWSGQLIIVLWSS